MGCSPSQKASALPPGVFHGLPAAGERLRLRLLLWEQLQGRGGGTEEEASETGFPSPVKTNTCRFKATSGHMWGIMYTFLKKKPPSPCPTIGLCFLSACHRELSFRGKQALESRERLVSSPGHHSSFAGDRETGSGKQGWHAQMMVPAQSLQACPTLCDPSDCSPPGCSVRGVLQARTLGWIAISPSRGSSQPRD